MRFVLLISTIFVLSTAIGGVYYFDSKTRAGEATAAPNPIAVQGRRGTAADVQPAPFAQPIANAVGVSDLRELAAMVHLSDASATGADSNDRNKARWGAALPKAQRLLQGACDCETRNWLNNFVQTGNYALSDSKEYESSVKFLVSLPKNDDEGTTHQVSN